jgi:PAS domain S-box-containing protein
MGRDITELKDVEKRLSEERNLLRAVIDALPDYIYVKDAECRFITNNIAHRTALKATSEEEVVGKTDFDFFPLGIAEQYYKNDQEVVQSGRPLLNHEQVREDKGGNKRWVVTTKVAIQDSAGVPVGLVGITRDVTEQKKAQEHLAESEEKYRLLFSAESDALVTFEAETHRVDDLNTAALDLYGYTRDEFMELRPTDLSAEPEETEAFMQRVSALEPGMSGFAYRNHKKKDGTVFPVEISTAAFVFRGRKMICEVVRDVTQRVRAEEERRRLEEQIQHSQKLESLGVLAGGIAHDFNNLLMGILGNAGMAKLELPAASPVRNTIEQIEKTGHRAADLCKQMLAYSGKGSFASQPLNLSELVEEMSNLVEVSRSKTAVLKYNFADALPAIQGDPTQLRQVVLNLITNASEAIGESSGVISATTGTMYCDPQYLSDTYVSEELHEGHYVYLEVSDTGAGIEKEQLGRILDPFFSTKFTGRGLGLAAVLGIVRGHNGAMKVYSEVACGTTFKVLFPATDQEAVSTVPQDAESLDWKGTGTILVVDDEEMVRNTATRMLKHFGFTVLTAVDGSEGVEVYREHTDDIAAVLLDMTMPKMSGEDAFREMRRINTDVRVVLSSGYNEMDATNRFTGKGLAGFIQKPYRPVELMQKLRDVLTP